MDTKELAENVKRLLDVIPAHLKADPENNMLRNAGETINALVQLVGEMEGSLKRIAHAGQMLNQRRPIRDLDEIYGELNKTLTKSAPIAALAKGE